ncbi:type I methionyl aminopeptidase [Candidatus Calescamantes bacterium]|nr:type I methionyl aminopeptidase [Candidatus Calescamantes bacterium]
MIYLKSLQEIQRMRESNRIVAEILQEMTKVLKPGISTEELEHIAVKEIERRNALPAFKGYMGYKFVTCISINEEVVHGTPGRRRVEAGDIVSIDLGVKFKGFYGDAALTYPVGEISPSAKHLLKVTYDALHEGIKAAKVGNYLGDISWAIQRKVESEGLFIIKAFVGHGIGKELHEDPQVPNFGKPKTGVKLQEGMTLAIEPMVSENTEEVRIYPDKWTAVTIDNSLAAHFEHTIALTKNGPKILSKEWEKVITPLF